MSRATDDAAETVWNGRYLRVVKAGSWEYAERAGDIPAAVIVAVTDAGELLLVEQYRVPAGRACLELPAGLVGDEEADEDLATAARRELEEETGYRADGIEDRGDFYSSPGMTSERFTVVLATGLAPVGAGGGIAGEDIALHRVPLDDVPGFVAAKRSAGLGIDAKLLLVLGAGILAGLTPPAA